MVFVSKMQTLIPTNINKFTILTCILFNLFNYGTKGIEPQADNPVEILWQNKMEIDQQTDGDCVEY